MSLLCIARAIPTELFASLDWPEICKARRISKEFKAIIDKNRAYFITHCFRGNKTHLCEYFESPAVVGDLSIISKLYRNFIEDYPRGLIRALRPEFFTESILSGLNHYEKINIFIGAIENGNGDLCEKIKSTNLNLYEIKKLNNIARNFKNNRAIKILYNSGKFGWHECINDVFSSSAMQDEIMRAKKSKNG